VTTVKILWHAPHRRPTEDVGEGHAGGRAYHTVAITNDATAFATVTSVVAGSTLTYDVEIWKIE